jgi:hypothetical protein
MTDKLKGKALDIWADVLENALYIDKIKFVCENGKGPEAYETMSLLNKYLDHRDWLVTRLLMNINGLRAILKSLESDIYTPPDSDDL